MAKNIKNEIICADVFGGLYQIPKDYIHLTFTSPPYNLKLLYSDTDDNLNYQDYLSWLKKVFTDIFRVTVVGGRCAINIDAMTNRQEDQGEEYIRAIYPHLYDIMKKIGWKFRTEICWTKSEAVGKKTAWGSFCSPSNPILRRNHEYILIWSKDSWRLESQEPPDIMQKEFEQWTLSHWNLQPELRKLAGHPAPFSEKLAMRVIKLFSFPKQIVLDPFVGTGTTALMAHRYGRYYIGIDNSKKYCEFARKRIADKDNFYDDEDIVPKKRTKREKKQVDSDKLKEERDSFSW